MARPAVLMFYLSLLSMLCLAASADVPDGELSGDCARPERLVIEGTHAYPTNEILTALRARIDFHLAAHPQAPLTNYLAHLQRFVREGYQRGGFPEAKVAALRDPHTGRVVVRVEEGPRFTCGEIRVNPGRAFTNEPLRNALMKTLHEGDEAESSAPHREFRQLRWTKGSPAPLDEFAMEEFTNRAREALIASGYHWYSLRLEVVPDRSKEEAELQISLSEGPVGIVEQIELAGTRKISGDELLRFLGIERGIPGTRALVRDLEDRLERSGRFVEYDVLFTRRRSPGELKLAIKVRELENAVLLGQPFSPLAQAFLKMRDWLADFEHRKEDLVLDIQFGQRLANLRAHVVISASGLAFVLRPRDPGAASGVAYAVVLAPNQFGLYSPARKRKLTFDRERGALHLTAQLAANRGSGAAPFTLNLGAGFSAQATDQPFKATLQLAPAGFVYFASKQTNWSIADGVLHIAGKGEESASWDMRIDAATGRLVSGEFVTTDGSFRIASKAGAYTNTLDELAARSAQFRNDIEGAPLLPALVSFLAMDLAGAMPQLTGTSAAPPWDRLPSIIEKLDPGRWFAPLLGLDGSVLYLDREGVFTVPSAGQRSEPGADAPDGDVLRCFVLANADALSPRGSWPWTLLREAVFLSAGQAPFLPAELERLRRLNELGPIGDRASREATARLAQRISPPLPARSPAALSLAELAKDWRVLFDRSTALGQIAENAFKSITALDEAEVALLCTLLPKEQARLAQEGVRRIRATPEGAVADTLWPAFEAHWETAVRPWLEELAQ